MYEHVYASSPQGCVCDVKYYEFPNGVSGDVGDFEGFDCSKRGWLLILFIEEFSQREIVPSTIVPKVGRSFLIDNLTI